MATSLSLPSNAAIVLRNSLRSLSQQDHSARRGSDCFFTVLWYDQGRGPDGEDGGIMVSKTGGSHVPFLYDSRSAAPLFLVQSSSYSVIAYGLYNYKFKSLTLVPEDGGLFYIPDPSKSCTNDEQRRQMREVAQYFKFKSEQTGQSSIPKSRQGFESSVLEFKSKYLNQSQLLSQASLKVQSQVAPQPRPSTEPTPAASPKPRTVDELLKNLGNAPKVQRSSSQSPVLPPPPPGQPKRTPQTGSSSSRSVDDFIAGLQSSRTHPNQPRQNVSDTSSSPKPPTATRSSQWSNGSGRIEDLEPGDVLGETYQVQRKLGEGGFGATFLVTDITKKVTNTFVAKAQKLTGDVWQDEDLIDRFEREAAALQQVGSSHGQLPMLFDYFEDQGNFFLIQELIEGLSLAKIIQDLKQEDKTLSNAYALSLTCDLLEVVQHLHNQGLIHRDIKPDNIILREGDNKPVLIDLGLVKEFDGLSQTGTRAGTLGYMPIEQHMGKAVYQSDLYAVGMVFLELTLGISPYVLGFNDQFELDLDWTEAFLGEHLLLWLKKATAFQTYKRFGSAAEMRSVLLAIRDHELVMDAIAELTKEASASQIEQSILISKSSTQNSVATSPPQQLPIITTQKEINAFKILQRVLEENGYDSDVLEMRDHPDYCDIHYSGNPDCVVVRLYFNDESCLAFSIPDEDGAEEIYRIKTLRGIAPKAALILERVDSIEEILGLDPMSLIVGGDDNDDDDDDDGLKELIEQEIRPLILRQITSMFGPHFRLLSIEMEDEPFRVYGQFEDLESRMNRTFDYEVTENKQEELVMTYRISQESYARTSQYFSEEDSLAKQGVYTVEWLQRNFESFEAAKEHFGVKARGWQALAEKISK